MVFQQDAEAVAAVEAAVVVVAVVVVEVDFLFDQLLEAVVVEVVLLQYYVSPR